MSKCYAFPAVCLGSHVKARSFLKQIWCLVVGHDGSGHGGHFGWDCQRCGQRYV